MAAPLLLLFALRPLGLYFRTEGGACEIGGKSAAHADGPADKSRRFLMEVVESRSSWVPLHPLPSS